MGSTYGATARRILVFTRYPVPGKTKTRLIPELGLIGAARLHCRLSERVFETVSRYADRNGVSTVCCFDGGSEKNMRRWIGRPLALWPQETGDIGRRMLLAFSRAFQEGLGPMILVGSDIPDLEPRHFDEAFEGLQTKDLVLGPSNDGGYWLVGMNRLYNVFRGIDWGTDRVFGQTRDRIEKMGKSVHVLAPLSDTDMPVDLKKLPAELIPQRPYVSVVIPSFAEEKRIQGAIDSAHDPDAEIIVVDGGSRDRTLEIARCPSVKVICGHKGRALQQNLGAQNARGEMLLFLHADTRLPKDYVRHVFETMLDRETVLGAFRFRTTIRNSARMKLIEIGAALRSSVFGLPYGDQALFLRRKDFFSTGRFPDVPVAEDLFLVRRMACRGKIAIAPAAAVTSGRRWRDLGLIRTFLINQIILGASLAGVSPRRIAFLYRTDRNGA